MGRLVGPDGRVWRVGRRWLAWRPFPPRPMRFLWEAFEAFGNDLTWPLAMVAVVLWVPLAILHMLDWAASLLVTPFSLVGRATLGRPWPVVAYVEGKGRAEYRGGADGARAADELVGLVRTEIRRYGEPKSLNPPTTPLGNDHRPRSRLTLDRFPPWLRRPIEWMQIQAGQGRG